jgi:ADP-ribose pyrophosphatase
MKKLSEHILHAGRWLTLKASTWRTERGEEIYWESIDRSGSREVVVVVARLQPSGRVVLLRQFRPAVGKHVVGFPAGLVDDNDVEASVTRELSEETGYSGRLRSISPPLSTNAALLSDMVRLADVEVDEELPQNRNPQQRLEPGEEITVHLVRTSEAKQFLAERQQAGDEIGSGVWYLLAFWDQFGMTKE